MALLLVTSCLSAASSGEASVTRAFKGHAPPRAGYYSGTTHRGREFSLLVTADHHVTTFKLNEQPLWPHLHLAMHDNGHGYRLHWAPRLTRRGSEWVGAITARHLQH